MEISVFLGGRSSGWSSTGTRATKRRRTSGSTGLAFLRKVHRIDVSDPQDNGKYGMGKQNGGWKHWYQVLMSGDLERCRRKIGFTQDVVYPDELDNL